ITATSLVPLVEEATDCQEQFVSAVVSIHVAPKFVDAQIEPPSPSPSSKAASTYFFPSHEHARHCHSKFVEASVGVHIWANALLLNIRRAQASLRTSAYCFD